MQRKTQVFAGAAAAAAALALPAGAAAANRTVFAGPPPSMKQVARHYVTKKFERRYNPDVDSFFNKRTTIHAGDTVSFLLEEFHTVDIPAKGKGDLPLIVPGSTANGQKDAAGNPFWFNGHVPNLGLNPALFGPTGGHVYNGKGRVDTGLPLGAGKPKPFKVKFTKTGTYKFYCDVHPGMVGYVVVKPKGKAVPSAAQNKAALHREEVRDVLSARRIAKTKVPARHVYLGTEGVDGTGLFAMFPARLRVKRGTVVTFSMPKGSREDHTASFGPKSYLNPLAQSFQGASFSPIATYPSSPYGQAVPLGPTSHGNGFGNTGVLDRDKGTPLPKSGKVRFTTPGTYQYFCLIHPFMHGTVVVTK